MLTTAMFELIQQCYDAVEIGNAANAVSACANQPSRQNKDNCFGQSELSRNTILNMRNG